MSYEEEDKDKFYLIKMRNRKIEKLENH